MENRELIAKAQKGDRGAFESLVKLHEKNVYNLALKLLKNRDDALDAAQDAFLKAWISIKSFRGESKFSSWLYQLTTNACLDLLRREKRHRAATPLEDEMELAADSTPQQAAEAAELRESLQQALDSLTPEHRQIFLLRQMRQLSYDEIGRLLGLESGTVKSRLNRAKKQLRQILLQQGNFFPSSSVLPKGEEDDHVL